MTIAAARQTGRPLLASAIRIFDLSLGRCCGRGDRCSWRILVGGPVLLAAAIRLATILEHLFVHAGNDAPIGRGDAVRHDDLAALPPRHRPGAGRLLRHGADRGRSRRQDDHVSVHPSGSAARRADRQIPVVPGVHDPARLALGRRGVLPHRAHQRRQRRSIISIVAGGSRGACGRVDCVRRGVRAGGRQAQAPARHRAGLRVRLGAGCSSGTWIPEARDRRLLSPGARSPCRCRWTRRRSAS